MKDLTQVRFRLAAEVDGAGFFYYQSKNYFSAFEYLYIQMNRSYEWGGVDCTIF